MALATQASNSFGNIYPFPFNTVNGTALIKSGSGFFHGLFVSAASDTPTLKLWDGLTSAGAVLIGTFTPVAATYYNMGDCVFTTGLYMQSTGTVNVTVFCF